MLEVIEEPPPSENPPDDASRGGRRWGWMLAGALLLALVVIAAGGRWWREHRVLDAEVGFNGGGFNPVSVDVSVRNLPEWLPWGEIRDEDGLIAYRFARGKVFAFGLHLRNTGGDPVRVTEIGPSPSQVADVMGVYVDGGSLNERTGSAPMRVFPFKPFTMNPGDFRYVEIRYRFADCNWRPEGIGDPADVIEEFQVVYEGKGQTRWSDVAMPTRVELEAAVGQCPDRRVIVDRRARAGRALYLDEEAVGVDSLLPDSRG